MIMIKVLLAVLVAGVASSTVVQTDNLSPMTTTTNRSSSRRFLQEDSVQNSCGSYGLGIACPAGCWAIFQHYDETEGLVHCQVVTKLGYYSLEHSTLLRPCDQGFFSNEIRASSCSACPTGSFASDIGNSDCAPCPSGYYQDEIGQRECKQCSPYYYAGEGSTAVSPGQFCQLEAPSSVPSGTPTPAPFLNVTITETPSSVHDDTKNGVTAAPSPASAPSATSAPSTTESGTTIILPAQDPWKGPFVVAAVSLGSIFIVALVSLVRQKRPEKERDDMMHDFTNGRDDHILNRGNPHFGIAPMQPPEIHDEDEAEEARDEIPAFSPLPPRDLENGVPEAARPAFVTPYHPEVEEGKFPDASFESFGHCYEDPEIAQNFPDHNDSTMAVVSQAVLLPGDPGIMDAPDLDCILFPESFEAATGRSNASPSYSLENAIFPEYNMSPMSGSFDL